MSGSDDIGDLWDDALDRYEQMLPPRSRRDKNIFITLKSPEALEVHLEQHEKSFKSFRSKHGKLINRLKACMKPFMALSDVVSAALSASPFSPASTILGAVCFVLKAADGVSEVYTWIEVLFDKLRDFTVRLQAYIEQGLPQGMRSKIVDIFGCMLEILACAEMCIKDGRWRKYTAVLFLGGDERVKGAFVKLQELFEGEQALVQAIIYTTNQRMDKRIDEISELSRALLDAANKAQADTNRLQCLEWISRTDFSAQQSDNLTRRQAGTGLWFLQDSVFEKWVAGDDDSWGLFCPGAPGAGKTTMAATVISYMSDLGSSSGVGLAFIYCAYRSRMEQTLYYLLTSLLRRLVQTLGRIPRYIDETYERLKDIGKLEVEECVDLLCSVSKEYQTVYIVIDAADECDEETLRRLFTHINEVKRFTKLRLMVTSRFVKSIDNMLHDQFGDFAKLEVKASDMDIRHYFDSRRPGFQGFLKRNNALCDLACGKVVEASAGMFLLARLYIDQISAMVVPAQVKSALSKMFALPNDKSLSARAYDEQYDLALERIMSQPIYTADLAKLTLAWMMSACRPLSPIELRYALGFALSDALDVFDEDYLPEMSLIESICAGLVVVDVDANVVRLVHFTTQEYLERNRERLIPDGHTNTALACISYLSLPVFKSGPSFYFEDEEDALREMLEQYPLLQYSVLHWTEHARAVEDRLIEEISALLDCPGILSFIGAITESHWVGAMSHWARVWEKPAPIDIIAKGGLHLTLEHRIRRDLPLRHSLWTENGLEGTERSCLWQAIKNGNPEVARVVLNQAKDSFFWDGTGRALVSAAKRGYDDIVQMIIKYWDSNELHRPYSTEDTLKYTNEALIEIADRSLSLTPMLELLLPEHRLRDSDLSATGQGSRNATNCEALPEAARQGNLDVVRFLLNLGYPVESVDSNGIATLQIAAEHGFEEITQLLLGQCSIELDAQEAALQIAIDNGHRNVVQLLLGSGDARTRTTASLGNGLEAAVLQSNLLVPDLELIETIIAQGADLERSGLQFDTALIAATAYDYNWRANRVDIMEVLIVNGADVNHHRGGALGTPLRIAAARNDRAACELLLAYGADANLCSGAPSICPLEATCYSTRNRSNTVVALLLDHGACPPSNPLRFTGEFMEAWVDAWDVDASILQTLTDHGIAFDIEGDGTFEPAVHVAARCGRPDILRDILSQGANITSVAGRHGNVLHTALERERLTYCKYGSAVGIVEVLLNYGADFNARGNIYPNVYRAALGERPSREPESSEFTCEHPLQLLLDRDIAIPDDDPGLIEEFAVRGLGRAIRHFVERGVDIKTSVEFPNLMVATCHSYEPRYNKPGGQEQNTLITILELGGDLEQWGPAALHEAAALSRTLLQGLQWLIEQGIDVNAPGGYPNALISCVSLDAQYEDAHWIDVEQAIKLLIEKGADIETHRAAALDLAERNGYNQHILRAFGAPDMEA